MTAGNSTPLTRRRLGGAAGERGVGGRARPARAGVLRRRADRGRRPRAQGRGAADGAGLRDAAAARPQRVRRSPTSTCSRSTRRSPRRCWRRWRPGATRCSPASGSAARSRWARSTASKLNVNGGSLAAGHPFAATGGRIVASLAKALDERGSGRGVISICAAGGQGVVAILEKSMSDRYSQLVQLPVAGGVAKRIGLPQPVELERGPGELSGRVLLGGAGRMAEAAARVLAEIGADAATALDDPVRAHAAARRPRRRRVQPRGAGRPALQGARVRRHRRGAGRAAPLLPSDRAARAAVRARGRARRRAARARRLHALARQGDRARRDGQPDPGRRGREHRRDAALPALAALGVRVGPGRPRRAGSRGAARRADGARHRRVARDRRGDRRRARARGRDGRPAGPQGRRDRARHHRRGRAAAARRALRRRARHPRPQRGRDQGPDAGEDARGPLAVADGGQPARARADHGGAAAGAGATTAGSSACRR